MVFGVLVFTSTELSSVANKELIFNLPFIAKYNIEGAWGTGAGSYTGRNMYAIVKNENILRLYTGGFTSNTTIYLHFSGIKKE